MRRNDRTRFSTALPAPVAGASLLLAAPTASAGSCPDTERTVRLGFYAYFEPVRHSAEGDPAAAGFDEHRGYEDEGAGDG